MAEKMAALTVFPTAGPRAERRVGVTAATRGSHWAVRRAGLMAKNLAARKAVTMVEPRVVRTGHCWAASWAEMRVAP